MQKKHTPTTAEIWPGQGRKQQEFPAAVVNKTPEFFSSCKNPSQMLTAASSSSESPTANTFRMPKKNTHPQLQNSRDKEKNTTHSQLLACFQF